MEPRRQGRVVASSASTFSSAAVVPGTSSALASSVASSAFSSGHVNTSVSGVTLATSSAPRVLLPPMPIWAQPSILQHSRRTRTRPRPKTSSERGQIFRQRQKQYVDALEESIRQLRKQISQLKVSSTSLTRERTLLVRTNDWGSLVQISRELFTVFRHGLEAFDASAGKQHQQDPQALELRRANAQYKQHFLRQIVDPDVVYGSLVGVEALITQWLRHTASYAKFEIEVGRAECIADGNANPVVMIQTKAHGQFSRESFPVMFPFAEGREDLIQAVVDKDLTLECVTWFEFSESGRIITYTVQVNYVEALVMAVGSVRLVAELMELSVVTPDSVLMSPMEPAEEPGLEYPDGYTRAATTQLHRRARSLSIHGLLGDSSESETQGEENGYFVNNRHCSDEFALFPQATTAPMHDDYVYEDAKEDCDRDSEVVQL